MLRQGQGRKQNSKKTTFLPALNNKNEIDKQLEQQQKNLPTQHSNYSRTNSHFSTDDHRKKEKDECNVLMNSLSFALNPRLLKKQKKNDPEKKKEGKKMSIQVVTKEIIPQPSLLTRNLLEFRTQNSLQNAKSLASKTRLKQAQYFKGNLTLIRSNCQESRDYINQKNKGFTKVKMYKNDGQITKDRSRMQLVNWLQDNKQDLVQTLSEKQSEIVGTVQYAGQINKQEFFYILQQLGIHKDQNLFERLFWLFDINSNRYIDAYEVEYALKIFRENTLEETIELFFFIADPEKPNNINENELKNVFTTNLSHSIHETKVAKLLISTFYQGLAPRYPQRGITREELVILCLYDPIVRNIINKNTRVMKTSKSELYQTPSHYLVSEQAVKNEGIFFAEDDNLYRCFKESEQSYNIQKKVKQEMKLIKKLNTFSSPKLKEEDDDDETEEEDEQQEKRR